MFISPWKILCRLEGGGGASLLTARAWDMIGFACWIHQCLRALSHAVANDDIITYLSQNAMLLYPYLLCTLNFWHCRYSWNCAGRTETGRGGQGCRIFVMPPFISDKEVMRPVRIC